MTIKIESEINSKEFPLEILADGSSSDLSSDLFSTTFHHSFLAVHHKLKKMMRRFANSVDHSIFTDLVLLNGLSSKKFLDHRSVSHLFRMVLSTHFIQKRLMKAATLSPNSRHLEIKWIPTSLLYPFSSKSVLGCLVGFNLMDRCEIFDEENVLLALKKHLPELQLVKESSYCHASQHKNLKIFYLEIEKPDGTQFSLEELKTLKSKMGGKIRKSIQKLSPSIFMGLNNEEVYKSILVLTQEIQSLKELPQVIINLDQQTRQEIVFRIIMVQIAPFHSFSLKERFIEASFVSERALEVSHIENQPVEAHVFRLHLPRDFSYLRSDGSLDFYFSRKKIVEVLGNAIGEFRDYNGGILIKQQEQLQSFKDCFPEIASRDPEFIEAFFYELVPIEKQVLIDLDTLSQLFSYYLENHEKKISEDSSYFLNTYQTDRGIFLLIHGNHSSLTGTIKAFLQDPIFKAQDVVYNILETSQGIFFNSFFRTENEAAYNLIQTVRNELEHWQKKINNLQVLRIGLEFRAVSLDPRTGGDSVSGNFIRLLFERLTRFDDFGRVENALAQAIEISPNKKQYVFKLRSTFWNDGSPLTAYDFEYAWKKILSPEFKTPFAYLFYPIKNAKEAKEGKVSSDQIGIQTLDDLTLKVELTRPTNYFLQLTSLPLYSPVHHLIDQRTPEWPYQCEKHYPCNGPFQLKLNHVNQGYQLIRNPFYWDAAQITLDQIILTQSYGNQAFQAFQKKEIDWIGNPFSHWQPQYLKGKEGKVTTIENVLACWLVFNNKYFPLHHPKIRQAFAYAINRARLIEKDFLPIHPSYSLLPPHQTNGGIHFPESDPEKAQNLLNQGLEEIGLSITDLPIFNLIYLEKGIREYVAHNLRQQFKECLNLEINLKPLPWDVQFNNLTKGTFQLGLIQWVSWINDPIYTLNAYRSADDEINFSKWENAGFQHWLERAEHEINPYQYSSFLQKAEEILCKEMPTVPLFYSSSPAMIRNDLQVITPTLCGFFNVAKSYFNKKEN